MKCPYCAEEINPEAIVCRYCHRDLNFYMPLASQLDGLEKRIANIEQLLAQLSEATSLPSTYTSIEANRKNPVQFYIAALLLGSIFSTANYAYFLQQPANTIFLWISLLTPIFVGIWIGLSSTKGMSLREMLLIGVGNGILASLGVAFSVRFLSPRGFGVDWLAVFSLYFLPPFFFITFGSLIGEWLKNKRSGKSGPPTYARTIAKAITRSSSQTGEAKKEQVELISKYISALVPILTFITSIISAWLTYLAATQ